jgi:tetratricopeptide (TPR) repeat protein
MNRVRHFQNALFSKYPEFVVPLSLLTDSQGRIVSIYRGTFSHDVILRDRKLLDETDESLRSLALPLRGTWITKPATPSQTAEYVGARLINHAPEEGLRYYELAMTAEPDQQRQAQLREQIVKSHLVLASASNKAGDPAQAIRHFDAALRIAPNVPQIHYDYGVFLMGQRDFATAEHHFRTALLLRPNYPAAQENLNLLMQQKGKDSVVPRQD